MSSAPTHEPAPGSTLYYSLLGEKAEPRRRFLARLALIDTVATSLEEVTDAGVVSHKVHWWHEELERLETGTPRHPATRPVAEESGRDAVVRGCLAILGAAADERLEPAEDRNTLERRLRRDFDARLSLLAHALDGTVGNDDESAWRRLSLPLARMHRLRRLPHLLHRGYTVFAFDAYRDAGLRPEDLMARVRVAPTADAPPGQDARDIHPAEAIDAFLAREVGTIIADFDAAFDTGASPADRASGIDGFRLAWMPLAILARLRVRQCRSWQRHRPDLLRERRELTPLMKFLVAWRWRRRLARR